jgi:hypothetical protein
MALFFETILEEVACILNYLKSEPAEASAFPAACCGVSERI